MKMWTNRVMRQTFVWLPNIEVNNRKVGYYTRDWKNRPPHLSCKEWEEACEILFQKLVAGGFFPLKVPKSSSSLNSYIQHAISPQNNPNFRPVRNSLRFAAYHTGFMEQSDIVYLENKAVENHGVRV